MNPYDFVPVDFDRAIERRHPAGHDRFSGLAGEMACTITAETPVFVKGEDMRGLLQFKRNKRNDYIIPASSLKGLFRSLVETVGHGCFADKFDGEYNDKVRGKVNYSDRIPHDFKVCPTPRSPFNLPQLCIACRMFGWLTREMAYTGNVFFSDAVCSSNQAVDHRPVYTVDLMSPKPHHKAFYLRENRIAGRKYYFHFPGGVVTQRVKKEYNEHIKPLGVGTAFNFTVKFTNLAEDELPYLFYALVLEENMRHKIGYAKPSGFGSVRIEINSISTCDSVNRYIRGSTGWTCLQAGDDRVLLDEYIDEKIAHLRAEQSPTMAKLREIWRWDPTSNQTYRYPPHDWFKNPANANLLISETP